MSALSIWIEGRPNQHHGLPVARWGVNNRSNINGRAMELNLTPVSRSMVYQSKKSGDPSPCQNRAAREAASAG